MKTRPRRETRPVLVTGFEPFGGDTENPSGQLAQALHGREVGGMPLVGAVLPCVFGESRRVLRGLLQRHRPCLVLALGLAAGREAVTPERVAINLDDARLPDNAGAQPLDRPIVRGGPAAYFSTLPVKALVAAVHALGTRAEVSHTAGTFVCNHVFYGLMHELAAAGRRRARGARTPGPAPAPTRGGFIHVPWPHGQRGARPGAPTPAALQQAVERMIAVSLHTWRDGRIRGGTTE